MEYEQKKQRLQEIFRQNLDQSVRLKKDTSNLFRDRKKTKGREIDVRDFNQVITVNTDEGFAEVEGMTTYDDFVRETLRQGFMPAVVPELRSITVGGAISGGGIESSSFRYGYVHETALELEVLLGDGTAVIANLQNEHRDLFFGFPSSYGTLGYVLKAKIKIVAVEKYVRVEHKKYSDPKKYFEDLARHCDQDYDFVDGTVFGENEMYITLGRFTDNAPYTSNYTGMKIYYRSIQQRHEDYLTSHDYIWRWDADWFWCSMHFGVQNPFLRFLVQSFALRSTFYWKVMNFNHRHKLTNKLGLDKKRESVIQDVQIPIENAEKFLDFFLREIKIKPVWICPSKSPDGKSLFTLYKADLEKLYINFGFWDTVPTDREEGHYNRLVEQKVDELGGKKSLYSSSYYTKEKFDELYNQEEYSQLKAKYDSQSRFKTLFEKAVKKL